MTALLIFTAAIIVIAIIFLIYFFVTRNSREDVIDVRLDSDKSTALEFENLAIIPGGSCQYELKLSHNVKADYKITLSFADKDEKLTLKSYVYAKVIAGDEVICDALLEDIFNGDPLTFTRELSKKKSETVKIVYYMPTEVDNDAKNAEAKFDLVISADNSGGLYE